jgi:hypothetical protein
MLSVRWRQSDGAALAAWIKILPMASSAGGNIYWEANILQYEIIVIR